MFGGNFCPEIILDKSQFQVGTIETSEKDKGHIDISTFKIDEIKVHFFFLILSSLVAKIKICLT